MFHVSHFDYVTCKHLIIFDSRAMAHTNKHILSHTIEEMAKSTSNIEKSATLDVMCRKKCSKCKKEKKLSVSKNRN